MNNAMESWMERASRGAVQIGAVVLLVCLTVSSSMPTPTFNAAADVVLSPHGLPETHRPSTQSTELARHGMSVDDKAISDNTSAMVHNVESSNSAVLSTVQTSEEDNRISTRMRRMSSGRSRARDFGMYSDAMKQLYSRTGYWFAIYDNETVNGTHDKTDAYTHLRITSENFGRVRIKGVLSGMYVCMSRHGRLYASPVQKAECTFQERFLKSFYTVFSSSVHGGRRKWYIGLNTNGQPRLGNKTRHKHQMAQFLMISIDWEDKR